MLLLKVFIFKTKQATRFTNITDTNHKILKENNINLMLHMYTKLSMRAKTSCNQPVNMCIIKDYSYKSLSFLLLMPSSIRYYYSMSGPQS